MKKQVLIVEDDILLAEVYKKALKTAGLSAIIAQNYNEAMKKFNPTKLSLVSLDIILQGKNGFELLRDFRKQPQGDSVPIMIVTGMNTHELNLDKDLMVSLNIKGIYTKSQFSVKQFVEAVQAYLSYHEK